MTNAEQSTRRAFLKKLMASTAALGLASYVNPISAFALDRDTNKLPQRVFGKTGKKVGIYSLGAQGTCEQVSLHDEAIEIINRSIDLGINYIDTSAWYGQDGENYKPEKFRGTSERYVGEVLKTRRDEVFIATKTHDRSYDGAMRHLESSLKNLQTDTIDLWQIHNVKDYANEDIDRIFAKDGVLKALKEAKEQGIVKNLGITGHTDPKPMKELLERYEFDAVLMAINAADKFDNSYIEQLLPLAVEQQLGIIGMKIPARDRIFSKGGILTMKEAMDYVLTLPVSTIIVGIDNIAELEENIQIAKEFSSLTADEMLAIEEKAKPHYKYLSFFKGNSEWPSKWSGNNV